MAKKASNDKHPHNNILTKKWSLLDAGPNQWALGRSGLDVVLPSIVFNNGIPKL